MSLLQSAARAAADILGRNSWLIRALRPAYDRLLELVAGERGLAWSINGVSCRIAPQARRQFVSPYEPRVADFLAGRVRPGALTLDVGANIGIYVLQLAHWSRPSGRVIAFEPNPQAAALLERHVRMNGLAARVEVIRSAVADAAGEATLHAAGTDGMSRLEHPNPLLAAQARPVTVPVTTIDQFCADRRLRPDWAVIDVEGFELAVLRGARRVVSQTPAPGIVVELHPSIWPATGYTRREVEVLLAELGLEAIPLSGQTDVLGDHGAAFLAPARAS